MVDIGGRDKTDILEYSGNYQITEKDNIPLLNGIIVMFSVENRLTYKTAQEILSKLLNYYKKDFRYMPILLYGNKTDVSEREVTDEEVLVFLAEKKYSNVTYKETSVKLNDKQSVACDIRTTFKL